MAASSRRIRRGSSLVLFLLWGALSPGPVGATDGLRLDAEAGLDGLVRAGRWAPVRVTLANDGDHVEAELIVESGNFRTIQAVALPSPARKRIELYVRAGSHLQVSLAVAGHTRHSVQVPVRMAASDEEVTVCIGGAPEGASCAARLQPRALPRSWRGLDAADRLVHAPGLPATLDSDQRAAVERWRALRGGAAYVAPAISLPPLPATGLSPAAAAGGCAAMAVLLWLAGPRLSLRAWRWHAAAAAVVAGSTAITLAHGRVGPGSEWLVAEATVLRDGVGWPSAFLESRGRVQSPAFTSVEFMASFADGVLTPGGKPGQLALTENGTTVLRLEPPKSARTTFDLEGFLDHRVLEAAAQEGTLTLRNVSGHHVRDCTLPPGFAPRTLAHLAPGAAFVASGAGAEPDPAMHCTIEGWPPSLAGAGRLAHHGRTMLAFELTVPGDPR